MNEWLGASRASAHFVVEPMVLSGETALGTPRIAISPQFVDEELEAHWSAHSTTDRILLEVLNSKGR